jgi:hypothetical protein
MRGRHFNLAILRLLDQAARTHHCSLRLSRLLRQNVSTRVQSKKRQAGEWDELARDAARYALRTAFNAGIGAA